MLKDGALCGPMPPMKSFQRSIEIRYDESPHKDISVQSTRTGTEGGVVALRRVKINEIILGQVTVAQITCDYPKAAPSAPRAWKLPTGAGKVSPRILHP